MARCTHPDHSFDLLKQYINGGNPIETDDSAIEPLICSAAVVGHRPCLELLLASGANMLARDYSGEDAIYLASQYGHYDCLIVLLNARADIRSQSEIYCLNALEVAMVHGHRECAYTLVDYGMEFNKTHIMDSISRYGEFLHLAPQNVIDKMILDIEAFKSAQTARL